MAPLAGGTPKDVDEAVYTADYAPDGKTMAVARLGPDGGIEYPLGSTPRKAAANWGGGAAGLRISRDGRSVAFFTGENLRLLGADGRIKVLTGGVGWGTGLTWSPRGDEVWYSDGNQVRAVTLGGQGRVVYTHMTDLALLDLAADGRVLAAATEVRSRPFFRGEGDAADRELTWLDWTLLNDLSADGRWVAFTEARLGTGNRSIVYLRETTGAAPMKLGEGIWPRLSPDGRFVVAVRPDTKEIVVFPVGAGPARRIPFGEVAVWMAGLLPDGTTIWLLGAAREKGDKEPAPSMRRMWLTDLAGGKPRPVTPVGVFASNPSFTPDGRQVVAPLRGKPALYPLAGGEPRPIPGLEDNEGISGFGADGRSVYVSRGSERPIRVFRVDLGTGRRELVREITPADRSGVGFLGGVGVRMSADGRSYTYVFHQTLSELYLVEGLK